MVMYLKNPLACFVYTQPWQLPLKQVESPEWWGNGHCHKNLQVEMAVVNTKQYRILGETILPIRETVNLKEKLQN